MTNNQIDCFSVLVIGDKPDDIMSNFDDMLELKDTYILYYYKDRNKFRKAKIDAYKNFIKGVADIKAKNMLADKIKELKNVTDEQYYVSLGELHSFDENKNIITNENPNGRWLTCEKGGKIFGDLLKNLIGESIISSDKKGVNWPDLHLNNKSVTVYNRTWDLCVDKLKPESITDTTILNNMKPYMNIFDDFKNVNEYIKYNCSFFTNAVVVDGKWFDMEDENQKTWIINYFYRFINKLNGDELITIYECTK